MSAMAARVEQPPRFEWIVSDDIATSPYVRAGRETFEGLPKATLFEDADFPPLARSIEGEKKKMKCRCNQEPKMSYTKSGRNVGKGAEQFSMRTFDSNKKHFFCATILYFRMK